MRQDPLAVGFDLDYTLWDPDGFARSFFEAVAGDLGARLGCGPDRAAQALNRAHQRLTLAHPGLFDEALRDLGNRDPALVAELVGRYHRHRPPAHPYAGVRALLGTLSRICPLFLVTDGHGATQRHKVEALGIGPWFSRQVFTGDFQPAFRKPSYFPFLFACARLEVPPARCVYVGDNPLCDFQGPRNLGMFTVGVSTGPFAQLPARPDQAPHLRIRTIADLKELL